MTKAGSKNREKQENREKRANGEGSLYFDEGKGLWRGSVSVTTPDGQSARKDFYGKTREKAHKKMVPYLAKPVVAITKDSKVSEWMDEWLDTYVSPEVADTTLESYHRITDDHIKPGLGQYPIGVLTTPIIQKFYNRKIEAKSDRTVRYIDTLLRNALHKARALGYILSNPAEDVVVPKKGKKRPFTVMPTEDFKAFLVWLNQNQNDYYVHLCLEWATGMRRGELVGLRWSNVNFKRATILVIDNLVKTKNGLVFHRPKTEAGVRTITVPRKIMALLEAHKTAQEKQAKEFGLTWQHNDLVFCREDGSPVDPNNFSSMVKRLMKKAGVTVTTFHGLRHCHATWLAEMGLHPKVTMARLGHKNEAMVMQIYTHVSASMNTEVADRIDQEVPEAVSQ